MPVPKKVASRLVQAIKRFQPILATSRSRDDGEADTAMIVSDMLQEVFGYDKFAEVTAEFAIKSTFCDLAIKVEGRLQKLIEVKAIGLDLKDTHVKQAVDYAANQGVDWVILTNGINWRVYKVHFTKPIENELVLEFDFCQLNPRSEKDLDCLYLLCKEGWLKSMLGDYHVQRQALSRFFLGATLLSKPVLEVIRRELRRVSPDVRIDIEDIERVLSAEVIKREVMEGDKAAEARRKLKSAASKPLKARAQKADGPSDATDGDAVPTQSAVQAVHPDTTRPAPSLSR